MTERHEEKNQVLKASNTHMPFVKTLKRRQAHGLLAVLVLAGAMAGGHAAAAQDLKTAQFSTIGENVRFSAPARTVSLSHAVIAPQVDSIIMNVPVLEGQSVAAGDTLVEFNCTAAQLNLTTQTLQLDRAKVLEASARKALERSNALLKDNAVSAVVHEKSQADFDLARTDRGLQQVARDQALRTVSQCKIPAPFSGQITGIRFGAGSFVAAGTTVIEMIDPAGLEVVANVTPDELEQIQAAPELTFVSGDIRVRLAVRAVIGLVDPTTRTQTVHLNTIAAQPMAAGLPGEMEWRAERRLIPAQYFVRKGPQLGLRILKGGKPVFVPIKNAVQGLPALVELAPLTKVIVP